jgi:beta-glucanase (GH16 family)/regulation of enolase protein 1 (concanavalin A-like superfamily)
MIFPRKTVTAVVRVLACVIAIAAPLRGEPPTTGWTRVWADEFDGTALDSTKWIHWLPGARRDAINTSNAVSVAGGVLTISTYTVAGVHYTGMISTDTKFLPTYGYIEARIDFDSNPGMWSAFWMQSPTMGNPLGDPETAGTEIDICEHRRVDGSGANIDGRVVGNIHWDGYGANHQSVGYDTGDVGLGGGYHIYGLEWTPTAQRFYIDGVLRWTQTTAVSQRSEFVILSSEVDDSSTNWAGNIPAGGYGSLATTTSKMKIDYVRIYKRAETPVNGDFEGRLAPFSAFNQAAWSSTGGRSGAAARIAPTTGSGASVEQAVRGLLPGTQYFASAWGNAGGASGCSLGVKNHGGAQITTPLSGSAYAQATIPFTTGSANRSASVFAFAASAGTVLLADDFELRRAATVMNGQFENGFTFPPWTRYGAVTIARTTTNYGGDWALRFDASGSAAGAEQVILGLDPATAYRFTGVAHTGGEVLALGVKNHGGSQVTSNIDSTTWTRGTVAFTTGAASTSATLFAFRGSSAATQHADAFFLYEPFAAPWSSQDLGTVGRGGVAGTLGSRFILQGSGADLWGTADEGHFASRAWAGDVQITARIVGFDAANLLAKTGVMIRESLAAGARSVLLNWTPDGTVELIRRTATGGSTTATWFNDVPTPPWVRLKRRGDVFTASFSSDSTTWTAFGTPLTIPMAASVRVGMPITARDDTQLADAVLDNVSVIVPPLGFAEWQSLEWPGVSDPAIIGNLADPDRDGLVNLLEFALALDPATASTLPVNFVRNGATLEFTYTRSAIATGITYQVQWSDTLTSGSWSSAGVSEQIFSDDGSIQTVRASVAAGVSGRRFLHLRVGTP